jgi:formate hydrogenlyase subunit 3/multisubunit Na+/H+ antiporter MnhD subunit
VVCLLYLLFFFFFFFFYFFLLIFYFNFFSLSPHSRGHPLRLYSLAGLWVGLALACVRPGFPPESIAVSSTCRYNTVPVGAGYIQEAKRNERPPRLADVWFITVNSSFNSCA